MSKFTRKLIGMMYENSKTNRNIYRYQGPLNPFRHIIVNDRPITAQNKTYQTKKQNKFMIELNRKHNK